MKITRKMLCILLAVIMIVPAFSVGAVDMEIAPEESDVFKKLVAFDIMEEEDELLYEGIITRASFVKYVVRCVDSLYPLSSGEKPENVFTDVDEHTIGGTEILSALEMGVLSGAQMFYPDRDITMSEASKILVSALGYGALAEHKGGYPNGYLKIAYDLNLFEKCDLEDDGTIGLISFFNMLMNFLETEFVTVESIDTNSMAYGSGNGETLLSKALDIHKITGVVKANEYASIYGGSTAPEDSIIMGDKVFKVGSSNAAELLGYNAEVYYRLENTDQRTILYIKDEKNEIVELNSWDIDASSITNDGFKYYDKERNRTEEISGLKSATLIYNGAQTTLKSEYLTKEHAHIKLLDYNRDNASDIIYIMDYRSVVVASVSQNTFKIADALGGESIEVDPATRDYDFLIMKNGKKIGLDEIKVGDVISYAAFPSGSKYIKYLMVSSDKATGIAESVSDDEITINSETYRMSSSVKNSTKAGDSGTFYIDFDGCVVWKKAERDMVYGYLTKAGKSGLSNVQVRIFTENNRWVTLNLQKKIKFVDGATNHGNISALDYYNSYYTPQFIRYNVNEEGEVKEIQYAKVMPSLSNRTTFDTNYALAKPDIDNAVFRQSAYYSVARYRSTVKSFDNSIAVSDATKLFMVPTDKTKEDEFKVFRLTDLFGDSDYNNVYAYDADESLQAKACVLEGNSINTVSGESRLIVVEKLLGSRTLEGEETYTIKGSYIGSLGAMLQLKDETVLQGKTITPGDVLQGRFNDEGYIENINEIYDISSGTQQYFCSTSNEYTTSTKMAGKVKHIDHKNYKILLDNGNTVGVYSTAKLTNVYIYDSVEKSVTIGSMEDIESNSFIFAFVKQFSLQEAVIIK